MDADQSLNVKPWLPIDDAPRDGTLIYGLYDGEGVLIRWAETRRCMLAGVGGGNGYFGAGWEDDYNGLIMDPPEAWMSEEDFSLNVKVVARREDAPPTE